MRDLDRGLVYATDIPPITTDGLMLTLGWIGDVAGRCRYVHVPGSCGKQVRGLAFTDVARGPVLAGQRAHG